MLEARVWVATVRVMHLPAPSRPLFVCTRPRQKHWRRATHSRNSLFRYRQQRLNATIVNFTTQKKRDEKGTVSPWEASIVTFNPFPGAERKWLIKCCANGTFQFFDTPGRARRIERSLNFTEQRCENEIAQSNAFTLIVALIVHFNEPLENKNFCSLTQINSLFYPHFLCDKKSHNLLLSYWFQFF